jgi:hypothetical protein
MRSPFYILTPRYTSLSGGPIALHRLCHLLNTLGYEAYVTSDTTSGTLWTPTLTKPIAKAHQDAGRDPIAIYPEVFMANPLNCRRVIRFLLNKPGARALKGEKDENIAFWESPERQSEFILHFAEEFRVPGLKSSMFWFPIVDDSLFKPVEGEQPERHGFLVYSHRVKFAPEAIPAWAHPYTMIEMSNPKTPAELALRYQTARALVTFERTGAMNEALLCGCPVVGIPNKWFEELPMFSLFGGLGIGWGAGADQLDWAERTTPVFQRVYQAYQETVLNLVRQRFEEALAFFAANDQGRA